MLLAVDLVNPDQIGVIAGIGDNLVLFTFWMCCVLDFTRVAQK